MSAALLMFSVRDGITIFEMMKKGPSIELWNEGIILTGMGSDVRTLIRIVAGGVISANIGKFTLDNFTVELKLWIGLVSSCLARLTE